MLCYCLLYFVCTLHPLSLSLALNLFSFYIAKGQGHFIALLSDRSRLHYLESAIVTDGTVMCQVAILDYRGFSGDVKTVILRITSLRIKLLK